MLLSVRRLHLQLRQWMAKFHPEFLRLLWVLADKQTHNYYALISAEEEIGSEAFTWSRARTFSFNKNSIGKAFAYDTATHLHHSVDLSCRQPGQPISSAECLMHSAAPDGALWCSGIQKYVNMEGWTVFLLSTMPILH